MMRAESIDFLTRPLWQRRRIEQMAEALDVPAIVLGLPAPTRIELAEDLFLHRLEQLCRRWHVPEGSIDRKMGDRKIRR
jgi:hypothetical protein